MIEALQKFDCTTLDRPNLRCLLLRVFKCFDGLGVLSKHLSQLRGNHSLGYVLVLQLQLNLLKVD